MAATCATAPAKKKKKINTPGRQLGFDIEGIDWEYETQRIIKDLREKEILIAYIDLFCGAGGTSTGVDDAKYNMRKMAYVIVGINHDQKAIESHIANHPETIHLVEDICEVNLAPIKKLVEDIRAALPYIKIALWGSAECVHHSKAKGGSSRDADSRSLPEEFYRYDEAIMPDLLQVENVTDIRTWGPVIQKTRDISDIDLRKCMRITDNEFGVLYSDKNGKNWFDKNGLCYEMKKKCITPWMVPDKRYLCIYFNQWVSTLKARGFRYEDRDLNSADYGAYTARVRYFGQFARNGMPILWPEKTHCKYEPNADILKYGKLRPYRPVREVLDFEDKGTSIFEPGRLEAEATFDRILKGNIKFVAGGGNIKRGEADYKKRREDIAFIQNYHGGGAGKSDRTHSVDEPSRTIDTQNRYYFTNVEFADPKIDDVLPFIIQFNNGNTCNSVNDTSASLTTKEKFALAHINFINQDNGGDSRAVDIEGPARTVTTTGGKQSLVDVEQIIPFLDDSHKLPKNKNLQTEFITKHYGGHPESKSITLNGPAGTITTVDGQSLVSVNLVDNNAEQEPKRYILRQFNKGGGQFNSIDGATGAITTVPKMNLITVEGWIMNTNFSNIGTSVDEPTKAILASRHHSYIVNPSYHGNASDINKPSPVVVARQDKSPLSLCQIEYNGSSFYGIIIYKSDSPKKRELKQFMAAYNIRDIKMRMLKVSELLLIQGFPKWYKLKGSVTDQKKFIGNSVEVNQAKSLVECYGPYLWNHFEQFKQAA